MADLELRDFTCPGCGGSWTHDMAAGNLCPCPNCGLICAPELPVSGAANQDDEDENDSDAYYGEHWTPADEAEAQAEYGDDDEYDYDDDEDDEFDLFDDDHFGDSDDPYPNDSDGEDE